MTVAYEERDENHREQSLGGWWWVIKHFHQKCFRSLFVAATVCGWALSWRRTTWGQHSLSLFLNKGMELQHALHNWQETLFLGMFTDSLRPSELTVRSVAIYRYTRDIAQHICAKLHLILTVVLISWPIGPWKKIVLIVLFIFISNSVWIRWSFAQMCCAMSLVCPSTATHRVCQYERLVSP